MSQSREIELRAGVTPLDQLHAKRAEIIEELSQLRAFREMWKDKRKSYLAGREIAIRVDLEGGVEIKGIAKGARGVTDKAVEALAHDDEEYKAWLLDAELKLAREVILSEELTRLDQRHFRDQAIIGAYTQEARL